MYIRNNKNTRTEPLGTLKGMVCVFRIIDTKFYFQNLICLEYDK